MKDIEKQMGLKPFNIFQEGVWNVSKYENTAIRTQMHV